MGEGGVALTSALLQDSDAVLDLVRLARISKTDHDFVSLVLERIDLIAPFSKLLPQRVALGEERGEVGEGFVSELARKLRTARR